MVQSYRLEPYIYVCTYMKSMVRKLDNLLIQFTLQLIISIIELGQHFEGTLEIDEYVIMSLV